MSTQVSAAHKDETVHRQFAEEIRRGLSGKEHKQISSTYLYDALGSALFEAITLLPEYGLTRADTRLLKSCAPALAELMPQPVRVVELGSGSGRKTESILHALQTRQYIPIDVSPAALEQCVQYYGGAFDVLPIQAAYLDGASEAVAVRRPGERVLIVFAGSTIGNFDQTHAIEFLSMLRSRLNSGDALLIGADLVKATPRMLAAYDDSLGVTAAFNRNVLTHINRVLGADFNVRAFRHEVRFNAEHSRIEMHLRPVATQYVRIPGAGIELEINPDETIWTESSHKYRLADLESLAEAAGFKHVKHWIDTEWPFAECLWMAE